MLIQNEYWEVKFAAMKFFYILSLLVLFESTSAFNTRAGDYIYSVTEIIAALRASKQDMYRADYFFKIVENLVPFQIASGILNSVCEYKLMHQYTCVTID